MPGGGFVYRPTKPIKGSFNPFNYSLWRLLVALFNMSVLGAAAFFLVAYDELPMALQFDHSKALYVGLLLFSIISLPFTLIWLEMSREKPKK